MGYTNFQNNVSKANDTTLNQMQIGLMELVFPIGSTYITQDNTNPNEILKFGTWERFKGRVAVGLDENDTDKYFNELGKTGGEKKHTLSINEIPKHTPEISSNDIAASGTVKVAKGDYSNVGNPTGKITFKEIGGGQAHNNIPPYEVVGYMWIRRL